MAEQKKTGKKPIRMKKQVRKTLGGLFLASAVAVAAIPTGSMEGGVVTADYNASTGMYTHKVNSGWEDPTDQSKHSDAFPIKSAPATGNATAKSVYIRSSDSINAGTGTDYRGCTVIEPTIPHCKEGVDPNTKAPYTTIYSTADGYYRFAYVPTNGDQSTDGIKSAVILAYTNRESLLGGTLNIPETVDAYLNLNDNNGGTSGLTAVGKSGNFLYYQTDRVTDFYTQKKTTVDTPKTDDNGDQLYTVSYVVDTTVTDVPGEYTEEKYNELVAKYEEDYKQGTITESRTYNKVAIKVPVVQSEFQYYTPCTGSSYDTWKDLELYYYPTVNYKATGDALPGVAKDDSTPQRVIPLSTKEDQAHERIANAKVLYIGNQYLNEDENQIQGNIISSEKGIFANHGNIVNLVISSNLVGIGDYAFYNCNIESITFDNGVSTIGNHAFDNCTRLKDITLPAASNITALGAYAFKDCQGLTEFIVPTSVESIGDGCFKRCWRLRNIEMNLEGNRLKNLGAYVFQGCESLESLTFPKGYSETLELSEFEGCNSLKYIRTENSDFNIVGSNTCDFQWDGFKAEFNGGNEGMNLDALTREQFYIEAPDKSPLHKACSDNEVSYKYLDVDIYELTKKEKGTVVTPGAGTDVVPKVTYSVNSDNLLLGCDFYEMPESLSFPRYIGPYHISKIDDDAFKDKCSLKEITIAENIESIGARAFQGCHHLEYVIFKTDTVEIGANAFQTQEVTDHMTLEAEANRQLTNKDTTSPDYNKPLTTLHFVGKVGSDSTAYNYAMSYDGHYNTGSQALTFIEYLSGWPTFLTVRYHYDMAANEGYSELIDFPSKKSTATDYTSLTYLTAEEKGAITGALATPRPSNLTEDQQNFLNAMNSLTIPKGVDAIKDGLFYAKTNSYAEAIPVYCYGLKTIETGYKSTNDKDGFPEVDYEKSDFAECKNLAAFYLYGETESISEGAFTGDEKLQIVQLNGETQTIGNHAFRNCTALEEVSISDALAPMYDDPEKDGMGIRPFAGCTALKTVDFQNNPYYVCDNSIIYYCENGNRVKLIEMLESRSGRVNGANDDFAGVTSMQKEAFQNTKASYIDLSTSAIGVIPERAFANTENLVFLDLPSPSNVASVRIKPDAFKGSYVKEINGSQNVKTIDPGATDGIVVNPSGPVVTSNTDTRNNHFVTIYAPKDTDLYNYADAYEFNVQEVVPVYYFDVTFRDWDETLGDNVIVDTQSVERFKDATPPTPAGKKGYVFDRWDPSPNNITGTTIITAQYVTPPEGYGQHKVTYIDYDDSVYETEYVNDGEDAAMKFPEPKRKGYTFTGWRGNLKNITEDIKVYAEYNEGYLVRYYYYNDEGEKVLFDSYYVTEGGSGPTLGAPIEKGGYSFTGWLPSTTGIMEPTDTYAQYVPDGVTGIYKVNYYSYDGNLVDSYDVLSGGNAPNIPGPAREGYTFEGWVPSLKNVTADRDVVATYTANPPAGNGTGDGTGTGNGTGTGTGTGTGDGTGTGNGTAATPKYYVLTVRNGSGSGSYIAGSQPIVVANDPSDNQEFSSWSIDPGDTKIASKVLSATVVTMPEQDVTVTANYKAKTSTTTGGGSTVSGNSSQKPSGSTGGKVVSSGTTVVIDKNGLSNTGVVSATVRGSSDNFTIKVSESSAASEAILKALQAEYGNDLSHIKYFPMDISLYDATGTKKITDTTGLSISITLPLPDSLITYAGNNKVAGVVDNRLDKLSPKFTTIDGVACVTFTAEHFSPYVIYVDTEHLNASVISDSTPKTGDGIHPKWFLSIGLACISMVLFMKKDKRTLQKVKAS